MISIALFIFGVIGVISAALIVAGINRGNIRHDRCIRYVFLGFFLCLALTGLVGIIFYIPGLLVFGGIGFEIIHGILTGVFVVIFTLLGMPRFVSTQDEQIIQRVQDPILKGFFPRSPGLVGKAPWLTIKPGWLIQTTQEIEVNISGIELECINGVILDTSIQVVCRVNMKDPMGFLEIDEDPVKREEKARRAISNEVRRTANERSITMTDSQVLKDGSPIRDDIKFHLQNDPSCYAILRSMSLIVSQVTVGDFDRDTESAEAARSLHIGTQINELAEVYYGDGTRMSWDACYNRALAVFNQNLDIKVWSLEGLDRLDPETAKAFGAGVGMAGRGGTGSPGNRPRRGKRGQGGKNNQGN
jgi:hypothetical protein